MSVLVLVGSICSCRSLQSKGRHLSLGLLFFYSAGSLLIAVFRLRISGQLDSFGASVERVQRPVQHRFATWS